MRLPLKRVAPCGAPSRDVFNANYLTYFDITMGELWRELGGYQAMVDAGVDMVVAEATIRYLGPLHFDDEFEAVARVVKLGDTSMITELVLEQGGEPAAEGELRHVFTEAGSGGKAPSPGESAPGWSAMPRLAPASPDPIGFLLYRY